MLLRIVDYNSPILAHRTAKLRGIMVGRGHFLKTPPSIINRYHLYYRLGSIVRKIFPISNVTNDQLSVFALAITTYNFSVGKNLFRVGSA